MITVWLVCLIALMPLMRGLTMWRVWAALLGASMLGKAFPDPAAWVLIDLVAAAIVIFPPRAGFQKAIAWLFAVMMTFELGWLASAQMNADAIVTTGALCGWLQLAALLVWGIDERGGITYLSDWLGWPRLAGDAAHQ